MKHYKRILTQNDSIMKHHKASLQAVLQYNIHGRCATSVNTECSATVRGDVRMRYSSANLISHEGPITRALIARFK